MRIDELKRIALDNKYTIERRYKAGCEEIALYSHHYGIDRQVVCINNETKGILFISNGSCGECDLNVIKASIEFAETDPEDREEEKKFYLRHKWMGNSWWKYLNQLDDGSYFIREGDLVPSLKNTFSLKEIEEIKKKLNTDLKDFELVEVIDEN